MSFTSIDAPQRSDAWFEARLGRVTGSRAKDMLAKGRGGAESVARRNYRLELALERITQQAHQSEFVTKAMEVGMQR